MLGVDGLTLADIAAIATVGSLLIAAATAFISVAVVVLSRRRGVVVRAQRTKDIMMFAHAIVRAAEAEAQKRLLDYQFVRRARHLLPIVSKSSVNEVMRNAELFQPAILHPFVVIARQMHIAETFRKELNRAIDRDIPEDRLSVMFDDYRAILEEFVQMSQDLMDIIRQELGYGTQTSKYPHLDHGLFGRTRS